MLQRIIAACFPCWITPDHLSVSRIIGAPIIIYFLVKEIDLFSIQIITFGALMLTDAFDGSLARHRKITSKWGGFIDGLSDKVLICPIVFVTLWKIDKTLIFLVCLSDFISLLLAVYALRNKIEVKANICGKCKMVFQCLAILLILSPLPTILGDKILWFALGLGAGSIIGHFQTYYYNTNH